MQSGCRVGLSEAATRFARPPVSQKLTGIRRRRVASRRRRAGQPSVIDWLARRTRWTHLDREKEAVVVQTLTLSELRENARQRIEVDRIVAAAQRTAWQ
ncbi:unnamed protein product, partial [Rangifer tarandus platyrhynchus]